ncbi:MAG: hypothetical protein ACOY3P_24595 [Planctomycetota bacterium]
MLRADLQASVDGLPVGIRARDGKITIDAFDWDAAAAALWAGSFRASLRRALRWSEMLAAAGLKAEFRISGVRLAQVGGGARSRLIAWLGADQIELLPDPLWLRMPAAVLRRSRRAKRRGRAVTAAQSTRG